MKAFIIHRNYKRLGKGFSPAELKEVELTINQARSKQIPVDPRRVTRYEENIKTLREFLSR